MPVDKFGRMSDAKTRDTGVSLTYINNDYIRSDGGTPVSGSINMNVNTLYNVSDPVNPQDVATKEYADKVGWGSPFFKENGNYQTTHAINMAFKKLINLSTPSEPFEATTKKYVDNSINDVVDKAMKQRIHLIAAHASYQGDLIKGEYQFTFGGTSVQTYKTHWKFNGFLMPHSGYIKRFVLEDFGLKFYYDSGDEKYTILILIEKTYGFNVPVPFFTLVLNKTSSEWIDLGALNIIFEWGGLLDKRKIITNYSFTTTLPNGLETYKINVKDVLNIRSEVSTIRDLDLKVYYSNTFSKRNHIIDWDDINDQFYTYLATILIELDPL